MWHDGEARGQRREERERRLVPRGRLRVLATLEGGGARRALRRARLEPRVSIQLGPSWLRLRRARSVQSRSRRQEPGRVGVSDEVPGVAIGRGLRLNRTTALFLATGALSPACVTESQRVSTQGAVPGSVGPL